MSSIRSFLIVAIGLLVLSPASPSSAQKFYPDDPLVEEPPPFPTLDPETRALSDVLEFFTHTMGAPGERHPERGVIPAGGVNTLGEVLDGPWYVNRHGRVRMTQEELRRGPGNETPPSMDAAWQALTVKPYGVRPGILMADSKRELYLLRFDPPDNLEMATGAEMVASRFFHALGYFVPENYLVYFERDQLVADASGEAVSPMGKKRDLVEEDIDNFLRNWARDPDRGYRAVATHLSDEWQGLLGPYQVYGVRSDDPNDIVPHEHRRDLRGLSVFSAWLNHSYMSATNTLDVVVRENDVPFIRHYLIDFTITLGSAGERAKDAREGNELAYDRGSTFKNIAGMGIWSPRWMRARYPKYPSVGHFEYNTFEPERWITNYELAPFANRLPDDTFWAAKQVTAFTDEDIAAIVSTGEYSNPEAEAWIVKCLIERRDKIVKTYLPEVLPLDSIKIENDELTFDDLAVRNGLTSSRTYSVHWSAFDNEAETHRQIGIPRTSFELPPILEKTEQGQYVAARIVGDDPPKSTTVFLRKNGADLEVVGIDRGWEGKLLANASIDIDIGTSRYVDLEPKQKDLFEPYAADYNERTGRDLDTQEYFDSLAISERTTFDAVTHALMGSNLTDEAGNSLGTAFDLIAGLDRIAGQYYGRSGDQQFRLYVNLVPEARETLEKSREFFLGHENTVYHVGFPASFRQEGKVPNIQFSVSEDDSKADIDVDYRSSKMPQAMWNGHLTSANSDVRAGDNHQRHNVRWGGFVDWWRGIFGKVPEHESKGQRALIYQELPEAPTPLPPDRSRGAQITEVQEAVQEFLTDWLVRGKVDEALAFMSESALACVDTDDDARDEMLRGDQARELLREGMEGIVDRLGDRDNLTEAIDVVLTWDPTDRPIVHPFQEDFSLFEMTDEEASLYLCDRTETGREAAPGPQYGTYYGALFRFKLDGGAVLGLLWAQENGNWRLVSYEVFEQ